ncbi:hypothetical protein, partial [Enterococcus faecium]
KERKRSKVFITSLVPFVGRRIYNYENFIFSILIIMLDSLIDSFPNNAIFGLCRWVIDKLIWY